MTNYFEIKNEIPEIGVIQIIQSYHKEIKNYKKNLRILKAAREHIEYFEDILDYNEIIMPGHNEIKEIECFLYYFYEMYGVFNKEDFLKLFKKILNKEKFIINVDYIQKNLKVNTEMIISNEVLFEHKDSLKTFFKFFRVYTK